MGLNYGVIGNSCTTTLISDCVSIDWLCVPNFDSPSVFASLLDQEKRGSFGFEVGEEYEVTQAYIPHTNILLTTSTSDEGFFTVVNFIPCYRRDHSDENCNPAEVCQHIRLFSGHPKFAVSYQPRPGYTRGKTICNMAEQYIESMSSSNNKDRQYLYSSLSLQDVLGGVVFELEKNEFFLLASNGKVAKIDLERERMDYCRTLVYQLSWSNMTKRSTHCNDVIERSFLTLKLLPLYNDAALAALTISLPETPEEVRNWGYHFCWLRDASMTIKTHISLGYTRSTRRFMRLVESIFMDNHNGFRIIYGIRREHNLMEGHLNHFSGCLNSKPVRVGNAAYRQKQNDSFDYLISLAYQCFSLILGPLDDVRNLWDMMKSIM